MKRKEKLEIQNGKQKYNMKKKTPSRIGNNKIKMNQIKHASNDIYI